MSLIKGFEGIGKGLYLIGEGFSTIMNVNRREISSESDSYQKDYNAIKGDWETVGKDLEKAITSLKF